MLQTKEDLNQTDEGSTIKGFGGFIKETLSILVIAFILSMILKAFVVEARVIPSGSMLPTIQIDDRVLVNKFIYRFQTPKRLEVIVFEPPPETGHHEDFIKRVIGLPGETVEVRNGKVFIDGESLEENYLQEAPDYNFGPVVVPPNCLFVMGDNRNKSFDSHMWNGWLTLDNVKGKAFFTYWPFNRMGTMK
ncbi:MAG: signal peptidase I [Syntrophomonadaceae bacterium]|nr:signal peptidase I [Syntrophomonadaceae bacterium]